VQQSKGKKRNSIALAAKIKRVSLPAAASQ